MRLDAFLVHGCVGCVRCVFSDAFGCVGMRCRCVFGARMRSGALDAFRCVFGARMRSGALDAL